MVTDFLFDRQFVIPGFVDTHIHAPQYPNAGKGLDMGLLDWLQTYTFPTETKFKDQKFAAYVYGRVVVSVHLPSYAHLQFDNI